VDDDPITNFLQERVLKNMELAEEIRVVNNGEDGIKCLNEHFCFKSKRAPDIILLDINMPVMDGFEFLKTFNSLDFENKDNVVIAVLSTSTNEQDLSKMEVLGIHHYITKPLTEEKVNEFLLNIETNSEGLTTIDN
jgi:CheY-like chemotaxis protein